MAGSDTLIGQMVAHHRIVERPGGGGMGVVYKAEDTALDPFVSLKFLPDDLAKDPQVLERFRREAKPTCALNHPNICTIDEIGDHDGGRFIAVEYLEVKSSKQMISRRRMELERMPTMAIDVALPNEGEKDHDHPSSNSSQYDLSGSRPGTPGADIAIEAGVASYEQFRGNTILHGERYGKYADSERSDRRYGLDRRELGGAVSGKRF
jgi:hypothetical protein